MTTHKKTSMHRLYANFQSHSLSAHKSESSSSSRRLYTGGHGGDGELAGFPRRLQGLRGSSRKTGQSSSCVNKQLRRRRAMRKRLYVLVLHGKFKVQRRSSTIATSSKEAQYQKENCPNGPAHFILPPCSSSIAEEHATQTPNRSIQGEQAIVTQKLTFF